MQHKESGNAFLNAGKADEAIVEYTRGIETIIAAQSSQSANVTDGNVLTLLHSNRAQAYIAKQMWSLALADAAKAIELDPHNGKSFLRRARALMNLGRHEDARADLRRLQMHFVELRGAATEVAIENEQRLKDNKKNTKISDPCTAVTTEASSSLDDRLHTRKGANDATVSTVL